MQLVLDNRPALEFKAGRIAELLGRLYPNPPIPLDHGSTFQLLCAVLLSAQVMSAWGMRICCAAKLATFLEVAALPSLLRRAARCQQWANPGLFPSRPHDRQPTRR